MSQVDSTVEVLHFPGTAFPRFCYFLGKWIVQINLTLLLVLLHNRHAFCPENLRVSGLPEATDWGLRAADPDTQEDEDKEEPLKRRGRMRVSERPLGSQCPVRPEEGNQHLWLARRHLHTNQGAPTKSQWLREAAHHICHS